MQPEDRTTRPQSVRRQRMPFLNCAEQGVAHIDLPVMHGFAADAGIVEQGFAERARAEAVDAAPAAAHVPARQDAVREDDVPGMARQQHVTDKRHRTGAQMQDAMFVDMGAGKSCLQRVDAKIRTTGFEVAGERAPASEPGAHGARGVEGMSDPSLHGFGQARLPAFGEPAL